MEGSPRQKFNNVFVKNLILIMFASDQLPYGNRCGEQMNVFVSLPSTVKPRWYSVPTLLNISTVVAIICEHLLLMRLATVSMTVWKSFRGKKFKLKYFAYDRLLCANSYSEQVNVLFRRHRQYDHDGALHRRC